MTKIQAKSSKTDFTTGSLVSKLLLFLVPVFVSLLMQAMYSAVDTLVVGQFGTTRGLSGVTTGAGVMSLIMYVIINFSIGAMVLIGEYLGKKEYERIAKVIGGAFWLFLIIGIALTAVLLIFAEPLALLLQAPPKALTETVTYIRICGIGVVFIVGYNLMSSVFRGLGDSRSPLLFVLSACLINIVLDFLLVGGLHMNVAGAALATVLAQGISFILSLIFFFRRKYPFKLRRDHIGPNAEVRGILKVGAPIGIQEFLIQMSFLALCAFINRIGLDASSGYGVANKIVLFMMLLPNSILQSIASFISQNVGAGQEKRARQAMVTAQIFGASIGVVVGLVVFFGGSVIAGWFTPDPLVVSRAAEALRGYALEAVVTPIAFAFIGYFNGHKQTVFVMVQSLVSTFLVRLPMAWVMSRAATPSLTWIGFATPTATMFAIVLNLIFFLVYSRRLATKSGPMI